MKTAITAGRQPAFNFAVGKWGNGLAMRLGKDAQHALGVIQGDRLQGKFSAEGGETILTLRLARAARPRYTLTQLLAGCSSAKRPSEAWLDRAPVGREAGERAAVKRAPLKQESRKKAASAPAKRSGKTAAGK